MRPLTDEERTRNWRRWRSLATTFVVLWALTIVAGTVQSYQAGTRIGDLQRQLRCWESGGAWSDADRTTPR